MNLSAIPLIRDKKRYELIAGLVADDLKVHKHLHILQECGADPSILNLKIHEKVFALIGIDSQKLDDVLRDWYYKLAEKTYDVDIFRDEQKLSEIVAEIVIALNDLEARRNETDQTEANRNSE